MYPISSSLRQRFERGEKKSVLITLNNHKHEDLKITETDIISNSLSIDRYCITGNKIEIGSAVSAELSLAINNNSGKFNDVTFEGSELFVKIGIAGVDGSYVPCGKFTVDEPPRNKRRINIKALDFMMLFDNTADVKNLSFASPQALVESICLKCDVTLSNNVDFANFANSSKELIAPTTAVTYRQLLQWVCQILGVCAYFDGNGELMLSWYTDAKDTLGDKIKIDTTTRYSGDAYENDIEITGVVIKTADKDIKSGTATNALIIENNQLLDSADETLSTVAGNIWNKVKDFKYRPYECSCMPMPYIFPLDKIVYKDQNDNEIATIVTHHNFGLNGASALAAKGETEQQRGYAKSKGVTKDEINAAIAEAMKGIDLKTDHFHVKYSAYPKGIDNEGKTSWTDEPVADSVYIGTCVVDSVAAPETPMSYNWIKIKGEDGAPGGKGDDGVSVTAIEEFYYAHTSADSLPDKPSWKTTIPSDYGVGKPYLWNYTKTTFTKGDPSSTDPQVIAYWSKNGSDGRGVEWIKEYYLLTDTEKVPAKNSFDTNDTTVKYPTIDMPFLWNYESIKYTDDDPQDSDVKLIGVYGQNGKDGISIASVTNYYYTTSETDASKLPATGWETTITPVSKDAPYLWNYEEITYTGGKQPTKTPACIIGNYAKDGENGVGITEVIEYYATSTEPGVAPEADDYSTKMPTLDATNKYLWNKELIKYTNNPTGVFTTPCVIGVFGEDGKTYYTWIKYADDATGANMNDSPNGKKYMGIAVNKTLPEDQATESSDPAQYKWSLIKGADGRGISTIEEHYFASDNSTAPPTSVQVAPFNYSMSVAEVSKTNTSIGYSLDADGYYDIDMNATNSAYILIKLTFTVTKATDIILKCINYAETNWDYMLVSKISTSYSAYKFGAGAVSTDDQRFAEKDFKTLHSADPVDVEYKNVSVGTHYVYIKVYKDGSTTKDYETFKFKAVEKSEWPTTIPSDYGSDKPYLWNYTKTIYTDGNSESSAPAIISYYGGKGDDGVGISSIDEYYLVTNSNSTPSVSSFPTTPNGNNIPKPDATNQYLWNYEKINYTKGNPTTTAVRLVCVFGKDGKTPVKGVDYDDGKTPVKGVDYFDGVGISSTTIQYASSTSGVSAPSTGWQNAIPSVANGSYLWTKITLTYTNGSQKVSYSVSRMGEDGEDAQSLYANCTTDASGQIKYAMLSVGDISALDDGTTVSVKFANGNSYAAPYFYLLKSNGTGIGNASYQIRPRDYLPNSSQPFTWDEGVVLTLRLESDNYWYVIDEANTSSKMTTSGFVVGNWSGSTLNNNVLIGPDSVDIRNGTTSYASYGANSIELGKNSPAATIKLCSGIAQMAVQNISGNINENNFSFDYFAVEVPDGALYLGSGEQVYTKACSSTTLYDSSSEIDVDGSGLYGDITLRSTFTDHTGVYVSANQKSTAVVDIQPRVGTVELSVYYPGKSSTSLTVDGKNEKIDISGVLFVNGTQMIAGWRPEEILYNSGATNSTVTLSAYVASYNYIEIFFQDSNGEFGGCAKVYKPNGKSVLLSINQPVGGTTYIRSTRVTVNGNTITPDTSNSNCIAITTGGGVSQVAGNQIYITRVVGIY